MTCPHCGNTKHWVDLEDGRTRCVVCFATFEKGFKEVPTSNPAGSPAFKEDKPEPSGKRARSKWEKG